MERAFRASVPSSEFAFNWDAFHLGRAWFLNQFSSAPSPASSVEDTNSELYSQSVRLASYPWQNPHKLLNLWNSYVNLLNELSPQIPKDHVRSYVHDLIIYDHGKNLSAFYGEVVTLKNKLNDEDFKIALRVLTKSYWIKDEVFVSHLMISPLKKQKDNEVYNQLGRSYKVVHINRPAFDLFGKKIEFDFSPKVWMLKLMRHFRLLRLIMPNWHKTERQIALDIRDELLNKDISTKRLKELDGVKGYRQVRYQWAEKILGKKYE